MTENKVLSFQPNADFYQKRARKALQKQDHVAALKNYNKAVRMEPDNVDYRLDLAECYALMGLYERSNLELQLLCHRKDTPKEALYGMGSNYMSMGDYDQAEAMLGAYLDAEPQGEFWRQAGDALAYMAECDYETELDRELDELSMDGKAALDAGDLDHAIDCLQKALEKDPEMLYVRNNLAVAYYCAGNMDAAWEQLDYVLDTSPLDVHGRCNESMFYLSVPDYDAAAEAIKKLRLERIEELDELFKYCLALADVGLDEELMQALKKIFLQCPYDISMLYLYGACLYNMGRYAEALETFDKLMTVDPDGLLGEQGLYLSRAAMRGETELPARIEYTFELPQETLQDISKCLEDLTGCTPEQVAQRIRDERVMRYLHAAIFAGNDVQMGQAVLLLGYSGCKEAEHALREVLLSPTHSTYFKQMVMQTMHSLDAPEPYYCLQDGKLALVQSKKIELDPNIPESYLSVMREAINHMAAIFAEEKAVEFTTRVWAAYLMYLKGEYPPMKQEFAWVKVLEGMYTEHIGRKADWKRLAAEGGVEEFTMLTRRQLLETASAEIEVIINKKDGE